jgi:hypothetical protein
MSPFNHSLDRHLPRATGISTCMGSFKPEDSTPRGAQDQRKTAALQAEGCENQLEASGSD